MALIDLLGRRWILRLIWELRDRPLTFRALRQACENVSPSTLNARLKDLRAFGLVELEESRGYTLSPLGRELLDLALPLLEWSKRWAKATDARLDTRPTARA